MNVFIIFPHQLFEDIKALQKADMVYLVEEYLFFNQYNFHQQKISYHRASMQFYKNYLLEQKVKLTYIESTDSNSDVRKLMLFLKTKKASTITFYSVVDNWLEKRIIQAANKSKLELVQLETKLFINTSIDLKNYFDSKKNYFQTDFYIQQRKRLQILIDIDEKPIGGKWSFDGDNRLRYPKGKIAPQIDFPKENAYITEAEQYVKKHYINNLGTLSNDFIYPTTYTEAKQWLTDFLQHRFSEFGPYEDAIVNTEIILHHSVLTPMLNIGLLTPQYIINETIQFAEKNKIALQNTEGFIRQIIGWREFIRGVYMYKGTEERTLNFWKFTRKIPVSFYSGTTGITPVDDTIKKVLATGYCHHIERLMVLGNFMLLCEFDPNEVYRWFMELFIDAYDWVMVPNVYGMSQFADGGIMATKPYISGSNYIFKMSNYSKTKKDDGWDAIWDALFWNFMHKQRKFFLSNPRLGMLVHTFDKLTEDKRQTKINLAEIFLKSLD